jgi:hypothetical protein
MKPQTITIVVAIILIITITSAILIPNKEHFGPFPGEVWGTVSDWMTVIVAGFTAFFIWRTLQSQLEVSRTQRDLLEIERLKFRNQFNVQLEVSGGNTWDGKNTIWVNLKALNHPARNIRITNLVDSQFRYKPIDQEISFLEVEKWVNLLTQEVLHEELNRTYNIKILLKDELGAEYVQYIVGTFLQPTITYPQYIGQR